MYTDRDIAHGEVWTFMKAMATKYKKKNKKNEQKKHHSYHNDNNIANTHPKRIKPNRMEKGEQK